MDNLAVLLIDMQKYFIESLKQEEFNENMEVLKNQARFFKSIKEKKFPIFMIEYKNYGKTNKNIRKELENQEVTKLIKESDGGFERITFKGKLVPRIEKEMLSQRHALEVQETKDILNLLLMGINRYGCVYQTGLEAQDRNYAIITCEELMNGKHHEFSKGKTWFNEKTKLYKTLTELLQNL
jgi:nicotinamidase-related amidase